MPIALAMSGSASSGNPPAASTRAMRSDRSASLRSSVARSCRVETRIGGGREVRRLVQHAGPTLGQRNHAARSQPPHGEPSRPVDHLDRGPDLAARLVPFRLGRERFAIEVEDGQQADAAIAARAGLDQQGALAVAAPQLLGDRFFRRQDARRRRVACFSIRPACARSWPPGRTAS